MKSKWWDRLAITWMVAAVVLSVLFAILVGLSV